MSTPVVYDGDTRYPGPVAYPPPAYITGIPTQSELDAQARMFTWGELKEIVREYQPLFNYDNHCPPLSTPLLCGWLDTRS